MKILMNEPITKNGPNGMGSLRLFFPTNNKNNAVTAPITVAQKKQRAKYPDPSNKPRIPTSLASPNPIPPPLITIRTNIKPDPINAALTRESSPGSDKFNKNNPIAHTARPNMRLSGIISVSRSINATEIRIIIAPNHSIDSVDNPHFIRHSKATVPPNNSTRGYRIEMGVPQ